MSIFVLAQAGVVVAVVLYIYSVVVCVCDAFNLPWRENSSFLYLLPSALLRLAQQSLFCNCEVVEHEKTSEVFFAIELKSVPVCCQIQGQCGL